MNDSPIHYLQFDESIVTSAANLGTLALNGTYENSTTTAAGFLGNAVDLRAVGTSDYVSLGSQSVDGLGDFTMSFWGLTTDNTDFQAVISGAKSDSGNNELLWEFSDGTIFRPYVGNAYRDVTITNFADGEWHHFAWTRSGTTHSIYIDGVLEGTAELTGVSETLNIAEGGLVIGQDQDTVGGGFVTNEAWDGLIDEFAIFDSVLNAQQIQEQYDAGLDPLVSYADLVLLNSPTNYWQFDEIVDRSALDRVTSTNKGIYENGVKTVPGFQGTAVDLTAVGTSDYVSIDHQMLNGVSDFTISFWGLTTDNTDFQSVISGAKSDSGNNELLWEFSDGTTFRLMLVMPIET